MFGVSLTFDVDGEAGLAGRPVPGGWDDRLTGRSEARFGVERGLSRVLDVLARHGAVATFYVPGAVARDVPDAIRAIAAAGHEVAHHGFAHHAPTALDAEGQRDEVEAGLAALGALLGERPAGYRAPAWELTPCTLALLREQGFAYDSSLMGDDRPYRLAGGLVELPVHWSLDDVPYFAYGPGIPHAPIAEPDAVARAWIAELERARSDDRHITYTMHPDVIARGARITILERLLATLDTPPLTHLAAAHAWAG
jgi:peptidoglycan/xylan/chitin deacetylase (PgdA/CDA1 family)